MTLRALLYAYVLGGLTFIPLIVAGALFYTIYTSIPVVAEDQNLEKTLSSDEQFFIIEQETKTELDERTPHDLNDIPRTRKGWLTMRRTFEESNLDSGYVTLVRSFIDSRSKDPKRSRPKDMWYVVLKGKVLFLYEDEEMKECEAVLELGSHDVIIYPEGLLDGELFARRNAICLRPKVHGDANSLPSLTKEMKYEATAADESPDKSGPPTTRRDIEREKERAEVIKKADSARAEALNPATPWFIFVRSNIEMEDWYLSLIHASDHPAQTPTLDPLQTIFQPSDMSHLVTTLDEKPDVIPMRWLNALIGRIFFSYYRTHALESYIIGRLMKKLSKVKRPSFLTDILVTQVSVGNKAPTLSKPMLKELTKEGDAALEVHLDYKGEVRITIQATATINLSARFGSYTVKLVLAAVLKELEGNLLVKVKRPPSNRIWYAFTQNPRMVLEVEPIVSDRQITWGMILGTIESRLKEIIQESIVLPNMDDIAFFETSLFEHRGGIWSDAARREHPTPEAIPSEIAGDVQVLLNPPTPVEAKATPKFLEDHSSNKPQSGENLGAESIPTSTTNATIKPGPDAESPEESMVSSQGSRRRSWFSSVAASEAATLEKGSESDHDLMEDGPRGRSAEIRKANSQRSLSIPDRTATTTIQSDSSDQGSDDSYPHSHLSPEYDRRSSSQHSSNRDHAKSTSVDSTSSGGFLEPDSFSSRKSGESTRSAPSTLPSSPTSFLSTLKSRAEKQALSNTAKEAMRKWGVNWGGLRKDSVSAIPPDELPDHDSSLNRTPTEGSTFAQKARQSYAEVRAAVAERRNKVGQWQDDQEQRRSPPLSDVQNSSKGKARAVSGPTKGPFSASSTNPAHEVAASSSSSESGRPNSSKGLPSTKQQSMSISVKADGQELAAAHDQPKHMPILVQPQAKTMTIPGIHASHRGEVMSMGFVAPSPPPSTSLENKTKNPGLQSVIRLWKKTPSTENLASHPESSTGDKDDDKVANAGVTSGTSTPSQTARPVPPPLPPRSLPTSSVSRPPIVASSSFVVQSPASDVLKSLATKIDDTSGDNDVDIDHALDSNLIDSATQESEVSSTNSETPAAGVSNPGPPLPPRRIPTSA